MHALSLPDAPADRLLTAARTRHSRRSFDGRPLEGAAWEGFERACAQVRPWDGARVIPVSQMPAEAFRGLVGSYGRIQGAPSGMLMVGSGEGNAVLAAVGYTGEALILEATALGLGTCWVGGMLNSGVARSLAEIKEGERVFGISPLGYPAHKVSGAERLVYRMRPGQPKPRKALEEIAPGVGGSWPGWARAGVEAARVAPSAHNRQPWRFRIDDGALVVSFDGPDTPLVSKRLDCGIAMLHVEMAVRAAGASGSWELLEHRADVARFTSGG